MQLQARLCWLRAGKTGFCGACTTFSGLAAHGGRVFAAEGVFRGAVLALVAVLAVLA